MYHLSPLPSSVCQGVRKKPLRPVRYRLGSHNERFAFFSRNCYNFHKTVHYFTSEIGELPAGLHLTLFGIASQEGKVMAATHKTQDKRV